MGWFKKLKKGISKAGKAISKGVKDAGKFVKKNGALLASIGGAIIPGASLIGGLASSPLLKSVGGAIEKGKTASSLVKSLGSGGSGSGGSGVNDSGSTNISAVANNSKTAVETKKKIALGSVAGGLLTVLSLLKKR